MRDTGGRGDDEELVVDGHSVRFLPESDGTWLVLTGENQRSVGRLVLAENGTRFIAYRPDGRALTKPSRWGGTVTARFGSRELAARALLQP
jgi:hypothetical protein